MKLEASAWTDPGPVRDNNEDAFFVDEDSGLFVVADGMGGHAAGEVASRIAVETITELLQGDLDPDETRLDRQVGDPADILRERLRYAMNQASARIRREALANPSWTGMGTTACVLLIEGDGAHVAHVGDSRIYLWRGGRLSRLTRDHTVVQQEIDAGRLSAEMARRVAHRNYLTQSVGYHGPVEPDTATRPIAPGDVFMLCSDGVTDPLDDTRLAEIFEEADAPDLAERLVREAIAAGGEDNITVIVIRVVED
ncbi:MAG: serine/threonine-protein phosphatase [Deltaproteobacteria bacterium]|nr:serine/threonine-protein phosphatase [Deltaproteobacteria bacterium]